MSYELTGYHLLQSSRVVVMRKVWHHGYEPFARVGSDTFIVVSPSGNTIWACEPEVVNQVTSRRADFHKPVDMLGFLILFGPTLTASEGAESRMYRRIAAPSFNDATHKLVWSYSLKQTDIVLDRWMSRMSESKEGTLIHGDVARLTLNVLSYCAYGREMDWKDERDRHGVAKAGHSMSYTEAISSMLARLPVIFFTPPPVLHKYEEMWTRSIEHRITDHVIGFSRSQVHTQAKGSFQEAKKYMEELRDDKQAELRDIIDKREPNLLDALVHSSQYEGRRPNAPAGNMEAQISPEAVLGNIFIFILAGHETNANTTVFALTVLACHPRIQQQVQQDLDRILGNRDPAKWTYERDFQALLDGYVGVLFNETNRLFTVLPVIPKVTGEAPTTIEIRGGKCIVPSKSSIMINTSAVHRNPKIWGDMPPTDAANGEASPFPVSSFNLQKGIDGFSPAPDSFVPLGEGARARMGQRFAKAGFTAEVARVLRDYSVELAVDGTDHRAWMRARDIAERELSEGVDFALALKMQRGVPLCFVRHGSERWSDM